MKKFSAVFSQMFYFLCCCSCLLRQENIKKKNISQNEYRLSFNLWTFQQCPEKKSCFRWKGACCVKEKQLPKQRQPESHNSQSRKRINSRHQQLIIPSSIAISSQTSIRLPSILSTRGGATVWEQFPMIHCTTIATSEPLSVTVSELQGRVVAASGLGLFTLRWKGRVVWAAHWECVRLVSTPSSVFCSECVMRIASSGTPNFGHRATFQHTHTVCVLQRKFWEHYWPYKRLKPATARPTRTLSQVCCSSAFCGRRARMPLGQRFSSSKILQAVYPSLPPPPQTLV